MIALGHSDQIVRAPRFQLSSWLLQYSNSSNLRQRDNPQPCRVRCARLGREIEPEPVSALTGSRTKGVPSGQKAGFADCHPRRRLPTTLAVTGGLRGTILAQGSSLRGGGRLRDPTPTKQRAESWPRGGRTALKPSRRLPLTERSFCNTLGCPSQDR